MQLTTGRLQPHCPRPRTTVCVRVFAHRKSDAGTSTAVHVYAVDKTRTAAVQRACVPVVAGV